MISVGEYPVVVDTETLLCARAEGMGGAGEFPADYGDVFPEYRACVGECMILPRFYAFRQKSPMLPGKGCTPDGCEETFLDGFREGYRRLTEVRGFVTSLLGRWRAAPLRYVMRSSRSYFVILAARLSARDDAEREKALAELEKGLSRDEAVRWRPVLDWEKESIRRGDVPYFWFRAGETGLRGDVNGGVLIPGFLETSPIENVSGRMRRMNERDLAVQSAYIRGSLRHIDGWESPVAKYIRHAPKAPDTLPEPLASEKALGEVSAALRLLWDERIRLSEGRVLWHAPLISGQAGSLFGLGEGFSGTAVFCAACAASPLPELEDAEIARALSAACFRDMTAFGEYLLNRYPDPPEERTIRRRLAGGFDFADGLGGYLWALKRCGDLDPTSTARLLEAFRSWHVPDGIGTETAALEHAAEQPWSGTDTLENGTARRAAACLLRREVSQAGRLLAWMAERKRERGVYTVFPPGRRQYFLPVFLRGSLGPAYVLLRYAEMCGGHPAGAVGIHCGRTEA